MGAAAESAVEILRGDAVGGIWIHLDAHVLDDAIMPAVDYRLPGGLSRGELSAVLRAVLGTARRWG